MTPNMASLLTGLPFQAGVVTRQVNAENPTGGKGSACQWDPDPADPNLPHSRAAVDLGEFPTIADNGTEDYFGGAWCFYRDRQNDRREQEFNAPFVGLPLVRIDDPTGPRLFSLYRWHILDPIGFSENLRVTVQALGWWPDRKYEPLTDDIASVAYWYQTGTAAPFPPLPPVQERWGR